MTQGNNIEEDESKIDRFQPKTRAMKSWKKKHLAGDQSKNDSIMSSEPIEKISTLSSPSHKGAGAGFFRPLKFFLPLSIISFFNESINGVFCLGVSQCGSVPSYYSLPKLIAFISIIPFLMLVLQERGDSAKYGKGYGKGVFWGTVAGILMFLLLSALGWVYG